MLSAGHNLRTLRERLGLTMRDVETASAAIATRHKSDEFAIPPSRLSDIETKGVVPSIYRLYSLAVIYRRDAREIMAFYGVDLNSVAEDLHQVLPPKSHMSEALQSSTLAQIPVRLDPSFDHRFTVNMGRVVEQWGLVPLQYLGQFASRRYTYGYVGSEDFTMYPILPPGTFVQIDESKCRVAEGAWRSEYERPIYFVETREGYTCCWCTLQHDELVLQSHPLSPVPVRLLKHPQEAEVIGQVVGVAMRLGEWTTVDSLREPRVPEALN
jgi:transcriptional regulator with XRE-family HTH domain